MGIIQLDVLIVGAGIVGLSTAYQLQLMYPGITIAILEKEKKISLHQTGRNSGVIHSGIYYKPGSLKSQNCIQGKCELLEFCEKKQIPTKQVGKIIVATNEGEVSLLRDLYLQGIKNKLELFLVRSDQIKEIEPNVRAMQAIWIPKCSIVNFSKVAQTIQKDFQKKGGALFLEQKVLSIKSEKNLNLVITNKQNFVSKYVINCAGLYSDVLVKQGFRKEFQIIPFKGEYFNLTAEKKDLVRGLIYPIKNPRLPFLGVHLTKMIDGSVHAGPNAVLALAREGYGKKDVDFRELFQTVSYPGFWKMAAKHYNSAVYEIYRSFSKRAFVKDLRKFFPEIEEKDLVSATPGIRAQVVLRNGELPDDFLFRKDGTILHVINAPSPAATACFAIGRYISNMFSSQLNEIRNSHLV